MGVCFEWGRDLFEKLDAAAHAREYFVNEFMTLSRPMNWLHPCCVALGLFEE